MKSNFAGLKLQLEDVFSHFEEIELVILFGSCALGTQNEKSDLDIAVAARHRLNADEKLKLIYALVESSGRAIDLIDLKDVSVPLLGQIVRHGKRILGSDTAYGNLISRYLFEQADFMPYLSRILAERRMAWIGK